MESNFMKKSSSSYYASKYAPRHPLIVAQLTWFGGELPLACYVAWLTEPRKQLL